MEGCIRVSAKTVEDAIIEASIQLGTSSDNIEYTIIERETKGFLGIGAKKAVIEAKKKKDETEEDIINEVFGKKDKKNYEKKDNKERKESRKPEQEARKGEKEPRKDFKEGKKEGRKEGKKDFKDNKKSVKPEPVKVEKTEEKPEVKLEVKPEVKPEVRPEKAKEKPEEKPEVKVPQSDAAPAERAEKVEETASASKQPKQPMDPKEAQNRAETFLKDMFKAMDLQVEIQAEYSDDTLNVDISGDDMGVLIGKRGQTLDSIQYLVSLVVNKGKSSYVRVKLDTENYRNRRKATLENLAKNIAFKVKKTRRPVYLEPMNPYERRIIHSALQNDPYVTTHSEGEEPCRKVVVTLKKREKNYYHNREQKEQKED